MKKGGGQFGNDGQYGAEFPFVGGDGFVQNLPTANSGSTDHSGISDESAEMRVVPGGGKSTHENDLIKPTFVNKGGAEIDVDKEHPNSLPEKPIPDQTIIHIIVFARHQKTEGEQIINDANYLNVASGNNFHLVLAGYSQAKPEDSKHQSLIAPKEIVLRDLTWYYDDIEFFENVRMVEETSIWKYPGGLQLLICDVKISDGQPANIYQMFIEKNASLKNAILIDVDELKNNKLFADFDRFFEALRAIISEIHTDSSSSGANSNNGPTWLLSDRLGLKKGVAVTKKTLAKVFKLDIFGAIDEAITLKNFAVRDIRK